MHDNQGALCHKALLLAKMRAMTVFPSNDTDNPCSADIELDLSGLQCPMPLLKAKLALNGMNPQQVLKVTATDPGSERDFHLFIEQSAHQILDFQKEHSAYHYWIKRG